MICGPWLPGSRADSRLAPGSASRIHGEVREAGPRSRVCGSPALPRAERWPQAQSVSIKEKDGVEGLVLAAGAYVVLAGQVGEKLFEFLFAWEIARHLLHCPDVAPEPEDVGLLGGEGFMLPPDDGAGLFDSFIYVHSKESLSG